MKKIEFEEVTTRRGDGGETSLSNGERRCKDDLLFEALGDLDELSSFLGAAKVWARTMGDGVGSADVRRIETVQRVLLRAGAQIATPSADPRYKELNLISSRDVETLEEDEKLLFSVTKMEPAFILPGGNPFSAGTDIARTVCRRAERRVVALIRERGAVELVEVRRYLNRLSDYLFVLARRAEQIGTENRGDEIRRVGRRR
jgi:cob(I)alamin adenosyltransferase